MILGDGGCAAVIQYEAGFRAPGYQGGGIDEFAGPHAQIEAVPPFADDSRAGDEFGRAAVTGGHLGRMEHLAESGDVGGPRSQSMQIISDIPARRVQGRNHGAHRVRRRIHQPADRVDLPVAFILGHIHLNVHRAGGRADIF